ncbi:MAG: hypothetical protein QXG98_05060 [Candidatus Micrarchaeia archaeon]
MAVKTALSEEEKWFKKGEEELNKYANRLGVERLSWKEFRKFVESKGKGLSEKELKLFIKGAMRSKYAPHHKVVQEYGQKVLVLFDWMLDQGSKAFEAVTGGFVKAGATIKEIARETKELSKKLGRKAKENPTLIALGIGEALIFSVLLYILLRGEGKEVREAPAFKFQKERDKLMGELDKAKKRVRELEEKLKQQPRKEDNEVEELRAKLELYKKRVEKLEGQLKEKEEKKEEYFVFYGQPLAKEMTIDQCASQARILLNEHRNKEKLSENDKYFKALMQMIDNFQSDTSKNREQLRMILTYLSPGIPPELRNEKGEVQYKNGKPILVSPGEPGYLRSLYFKLKNIYQNTLVYPKGQPKGKPAVPDVK